MLTGLRLCLVASVPGCVALLCGRSRATVEEERRRGFTHSHNDNLDVLNSVGKEQ